MGAFDGVASCFERSSLPFLDSGQQVGGMCGLLRCLFESRAATVNRLVVTIKLIAKYFNNQLITVNNFNQQ